MRSRLSVEAAAQHGDVDRGLTIVELLVVVAVIAAVLSLLLPALGSVKRSGGAVACASNLRQIGLAHVMYMNVNRDMFAPAGLSHGGAPGDPRNSWLTVLSPYMDGHAALRSPVDRSPYWSVDDGGDHNGMTLKQAIAHLEQNPAATIPPNLISRWSSYGVNVMLTDLWSGYPEPPGTTGKFTKWLRLHSVPRPEMTVHFLMMTEGEGAGDPKFARTDHADTDTWVSMPVSKAHLALQRAAKQTQMHAHGGRAGSWAAAANYGFLDGRVETLRFNVVYEDPKRNRFLPIATPSN